MRIFQGQMSQFMSIPPFRSSSSTMRSSSPMEYWVPAWGIGSRVVNRGTGPWSPHRALVLRMQNAMPPIFGTCHAVGPKPHLAPLLDPGKDLPRTTAVEGSFGLQPSAFVLTHRTWGKVLSADSPLKRPTNTSMTCIPGPEKPLKHFWDAGRTLMMGGMCCANALDRHLWSKNPTRRCVWVAAFNFGPRNSFCSQQRRLVG